MIKMFVAAAAVLIVFASCQGDMEPFERGDPQGERKVLIAATASDFKVRLVEAVIEQVGTDRCYFRIIGLDALEEAAYDGYQAILIINAFMAGGIDGRAARFLEENAGDSRIILFSTIGDENHPPAGRVRPASGIDAVTAASVTDRAEERAAELAALIQARF